MVITLRVDRASELFPLFHVSIVHYAVIGIIIHELTAERVFQIRVDIHQQVVQMMHWRVDLGLDHVLHLFHVGSSNAIGKCRDVFVRGPVLRGTLVVTFRNNSLVESDSREMLGFWKSS